jgi:cell wall-associated NlpC family hydrolase
LLTKVQIEAVLKEAMTWLKTPYHAHARIKGLGVDCAQFLIGVAVGAGIFPAINVRGDYSTVVPQGTEYVDVILNYCDEITEQEAQPSDIALYKTSHGWMHSAIVIEWPHSIIHATEKRGVIMTSGDEDFLRGKPRRFFRMRGGN